MRQKRRPQSTREITISVKQHQHQAVCSRLRGPQLIGSDLGKAPQVLRTDKSSSWLAEGLQEINLIDTEHFTKNPSN